MNAFDKQWPLHSAAFKLNYFLGLSVTEISTTLETKPALTKQNLLFSRAWLKRTSEPSGWFSVEILLPPRIASQNMSEHELPEIFAAALEADNATSRDRIIQEMCGDNTELRNNVVSLLKAADSDTQLHSAILQKELHDL